METSSLPPYNGVINRVRDLPNRDGNEAYPKLKAEETPFVTFLTGMETRFLSLVPIARNCS